MELTVFDKLIDVKEDGSRPYIQDLLAIVSKEVFGDNYELAYFERPNMVCGTCTAMVRDSAQHFHVLTITDDWCISFFHDNTPMHFNQTDVYRKLTEWGFIDLSKNVVTDLLTYTCSYCGGSFELSKKNPFARRILFEGDFLNICGSTCLTTHQVAVEHDAYMKEHPDGSGSIQDAFAEDFIKAYKAEEEVPKCVHCKSPNIEKDDVWCADCARPFNGELLDLTKGSKKG